MFNCFSQKLPYLRHFCNDEMLSDGKDFNMSLVVSMGYCIEVVGKEGQGVEDTLYVCTGCRAC